MVLCVPLLFRVLCGEQPSRDLDFGETDPAVPVQSVKSVLVLTNRAVWVDQRMLSPSAWRSRACQQQGSKTDPSDSTETAGYHALSKSAIIGPAPVTHLHGVEAVAGRGGLALLLEDANIVAWRSSSARGQAGGTAVAVANVAHVLSVYSA